MLIRIAGAIIGGLIAGAFNLGDLGDFFDIGTWIIGTLGSLLLLASYRAATARATHLGSPGRACVAVSRQLDDLDELRRDGRG